METKEERDNRKKDEDRVESLLDRKYQTEIELSDDSGDNELLRNVHKDSILGHGKKIYQIIPESMDFMKELLFKLKTRPLQGEYDISIADKSQLIVWVYKDLKHLHKKNEELTKANMELRSASEAKDVKIEKLSYQVEKLTQARETLECTIRDLQNRNNFLGKNLVSVRRKYQELSNMNSEEIERISQMEELRKQTELQILETTKNSNVKTACCSISSKVGTITTVKEPSKERSIPIFILTMLLNDRIKYTFLSFLQTREILIDLALVSKTIQLSIYDFRFLSPFILSKIYREFKNKLTMISNDIGKQERLREKTVKEIQSDPDIPHFYRKYIIESKESPMNPSSEKALKHTRLFVCCHDVFKPPSEGKGLLKSIYGMFAKKSEIADLPDELSEAELEAINKMEQEGNVELLYKGLQESVSRRSSNQNEVSKWFYNLELCFCENYFGLAHMSGEASGLLKLCRMLNVKYEYHKKRGEELEFRLEDLSNQIAAAESMKRFLMTRVREMESSQMYISTEIIQQRKEAILSRRRAEELEEQKSKTDKENQNLRKIIAKKVKSLTRKLERVTAERDNLCEQFRGLHGFLSNELHL